MLKDLPDLVLYGVDPLLSHLIQRDSPIPGPFSIQWLHHKTLNRNEESGRGGRG